MRNYTATLYKLSCKLNDFDNSFLEYISNNKNEYCSIHGHLYNTCNRNIIAQDAEDDYEFPVVDFMDLILRYPNSKIINGRISRINDDDYESLQDLDDYSSEDYTLENFSSNNHHYYFYTLENFSRRM